MENRVHFDSMELKKASVLPFTDILRQQWYLTKSCFHVAAKYMVSHIFESVKLQVSIFLESILFLNYILDVVENEGEWTKVFWSIIVLMAGIAISTVSFSYYTQLALPKLKVQLYSNMKKELYEKLTKVTLSYYDNRDFYKKIVWSINEIDQCINQYLEILRIYCGSITQLILTIVFSSIINPAVLLVPAVLFPIGLIIEKKESQILIAAQMERMQYEQKREYLNRVFYQAEYAKELRLNTDMQEKMREDFRKANRKIEKTNRAYAGKILIYGCMNVVYSRLFREGMVWGILLYQAIVLRNLSYTHLVLSGVCCTRIMQQLEELTNNWKTIEENSFYIKEIRKLFLLNEDQYQGGRTLTGNSNNLVIRNLDFQYVDGNPILKDVNCMIKPGKKVAIVGYNGAGKTTLIKLILKLYSPAAGTIEYGGVDIRDLDTKAYRFSIGAVLQEFKIYACTLGENILLDVGKNRVDESKKIEEALQEAHFLSADGELLLPVSAQLTTEYEKKGVDISGGERQKIAIARAIYHNQNMIIMDEANSALDPLSEYNMNQELNKLAQEKTVIYITHRLSTTRDADYIYMFAGGRIVEEGTHSTLLAGNGLYAEMWAAQAQLYSDVFVNSC